MSHGTCHMSCVMCHMSHVTFFYLFFLQSGEGYRRRVCYQWGLPCLVFIFTGYLFCIVLWPKVFQPYFNIKTCCIVNNNKYIPDRAVSWRILRRLSSVRNKKKIPKNAFLHQTILQHLSNYTVLLLGEVQKRSCTNEKGQKK